MKILLAEYAVGSGVEEFMLEGRAMLSSLARSFISCRHEVFYPTKSVKLDVGKAFMTENFENALEKLSKKCDAALVIAPDEILGDLTELVEENTANLGCPSKSVRLCADKLKCTRVLEKENIPVPETVERGNYEGDYEGDYVVKPRFGCASEGIYRSRKGILKKGFIATKFISGEHLSASIITGRTQLPLTINRQLIEINDSISYKGGVVPYNCDRNEEIIEVAKKTLKILGCKGYAGVDIVLGDKPYVVDVNPRITTSIVGIAKVLQAEIAELIINSRFGELPDKVNIKGSFTFKKEELAFL